MRGMLPLQAPLLPETADLPTSTPSQTITNILGVKQVLSELVYKASDPPGVLDALASLLDGSSGGSDGSSGSAAQSTSALVQRMHYVHLAIKALLGLAAGRKVRMHLAFCEACGCPAGPALACHHVAQMHENTAERQRANRCQCA